MGDQRPVESRSRCAKKYQGDLQFWKSGMPFGTRLRKARLDRGLTTIELARLADLHQPHVSRLENTEAEPSAQTVRKMSRILGVSADYLLELQNRKKPRR